jgi:hypothetical protein
VARARQLVLSAALIAAQRVVVGLEDQSITAMKWINTRRAGAMSVIIPAAVDVFKTKNKKS